MKKYREINFTWNKIGSFRRGDPFTILFVYPMNGDPIVVKGGANAVERWRKRLSIPCFTRYTYWWHGKSRGGWTFENVKGFYLNSWVKDNLKDHGRPYIIMNGGQVIAKLRKVPNAFPKAVKEILDARN